MSEVEAGDVVRDRFTDTLVTVKEVHEDSAGEYVNVEAVDGTDIGIGTRGIEDLEVN